MRPEDIAKKVRESAAADAAGKVHGTADKVYQALTRPDRPLGPETDKKPWLAALLSLVLVGAGQVYNRQYAKAFWLFLFFYPLGVSLVVLYFVLDWAYSLGERNPELSVAFQIIWGTVWLFAVVDAYRIARALRDGRLVVRYGFLRQSVYFAAGFIPFAGVLVPEETVAPEEVNKAVGLVVVDVAKGRAIGWVLKRVIRYGCLGLGGVLLLIGVLAQVHWLVLLGGLLLVIGILFMLF